MPIIIIGLAYVLTKIFFQFQCQQCLRRFDNKDYLRRHIGLCTMCPKCGFYNEPRHFPKCHGEWKKKSTPVRIASVLKLMSTVMSWAVMEIQTTMPGSPRNPQWLVIFLTTNFLQFIAFLNEHLQLLLPQINAKCISLTNLSLQNYYYCQCKFIPNK